MRTQAGNQHTGSGGGPRTEFGERLFQAISRIPVVDGFSEDNLDVIYGLAYAHVSQRQYQHATPIFLLLIQLSPTTQTYWRGLALCHQMLGRNKDAIALYEFVNVLFGQSEEVLLRIAECHIAEHQPERALAALAPLAEGRITVSTEVNTRARALTLLLSKET